MVSINADFRPAYFGNIDSDKQSIDPCKPLGVFWMDGTIASTCCPIVLTDDDLYALFGQKLEPTRENYLLHHLLFWACRRLIFSAVGGTVRIAIRSQILNCYFRIVFLEPYDAIFKSNIFFVSHTTGSSAHKKIPGIIIFLVHFIQHH